MHFLQNELGQFGKQFVQRVYVLFNDSLMRQDIPEVPNVDQLIRDNRLKQYKEEIDETYQIFWIFFVQIF
jgi:hypothetical protein